MTISMLSLHIKNKEHPIYYMWSKNRTPANNTKSGNPYIFHVVQKIGDHPSKKN